MYKVNDTVIYGAVGVCTILDITESTIGGVKNEYYVLQTIGLNKSSIYVPTNNEKLLAKIRYLHTPSEIKSLIKKADKIKVDWNINHNQRNIEFRAILSEGKTEKLVALSRKINEVKSDKANKEIHASKGDEKFLKETLNMLFNEIEYVLNISFEEMLELVK